MNGFNLTLSLFNLFFLFKVVFSPSVLQHKITLSEQL